MARGSRSSRVARFVTTVGLPSSLYRVFGNGGTVATRGLAPSWHGMFPTPIFHPVSTV